MQKRKEKFLKIAFAAYILLMLWLLFGQRMDRWKDGYSFAALWESVNLIPFRTMEGFLGKLRGDDRSHAVVNLFGNVIMFLPLGFFIPAAYRKADSFFRTLLWAAVTVVCVELLQFVTMLGSMDIDDLILNLAGAAMGYGIYSFVKRGKANF